MFLPETQFFFPTLSLMLKSSARMPFLSVSTLWITAVILIVVPNI